MTVTRISLMRLGGRGIANLIRFVERTSDIVYEPADLKPRLRATHPCIVAGWHGQFMMLACLHPGDIRVEAMVARHGDAELIGAALERLNTHLIRGAGAGDRKRDRGGAAALRLSVKALTDGSSLVMTADIPPGPARIAGLGIIMIARLSGRPIVPVAAATGRFASFDTWSRMTVNLPWSRLAFVGGDPIHVPGDADAVLMEAKRLELEQALNAATQRAYELTGANIDRATPLDLLAARSPPPPSLALKVYRLGMSAARPIVPFLLGRREKRGKEDARRRGERLGFAGLARPDGPLIWVHAASVGETISVLPLIDDLLKEAPDAHLLLTTGTTTSAALAANRLPPRALHQFAPLDVPQYVDRFLDHWRPGLAIFTESDIWPNIVLATAARGLPLALVNARMSPRSQRRWRKNARFGRPLFSRFSLVTAQNAGVARTIKRLGAPNVIVTGNLKIDAPPAPVDQSALGALKTATDGRPIFLAASTHPGEEAAIIDAHRAMIEKRPDLLTIVAPRHPDRGAPLQDAFIAGGFRAKRRSHGQIPDAASSVYIADTIGELGTLYALAPFAFVGGSLIPHGGQNPIEAIRHGAAVITGPHFHNFRDTVEAVLADGGAIVVDGSPALARAALGLLDDPAALASMRAKATSSLERLSGGQSATMDALMPLIVGMRT